MDEALGKNSQYHFKKKEKERKLYLIWQITKISRLYSFSNKSYYLDVMLSNLPPSYFDNFLRVWMTAYVATTHVLVRM